MNDNDDEADEEEMVVKMRSSKKPFEGLIFDRSSANIQIPQEVGQEVKDGGGNANEVGQEAADIAVDGVGQHGQSKDGREGQNPGLVQVHHGAHEDSDEAFGRDHGIDLGVQVGLCPQNVELQGHENKSAKSYIFG